MRLATIRDVMSSVIQDVQILFPSGCSRDMGAGVGAA
jgi:hypothetical protein